MLNRARIAPLSLEKTAGDGSTTVPVANPQVSITSLIPCPLLRRRPGRRRRQRRTRRRPALPPRRRRDRRGSAGRHWTAILRQQGRFVQIRAAGRSGARSPSKCGTNVRSPAPGAAARASALNSSWEAPINRETGSVTVAAVRVQAGGGHRPEASTKPAAHPDGSVVGASATVKTVPEVPEEMEVEPTSSPIPSAAASCRPSLGRQGCSPSRPHPRWVREPRGALLPNSGAGRPETVGQVAKGRSAATNSRCPADLTAEAASPCGAS